MARLTAPAASLAAALLWVALAWRTPSSTYHFAPLIVAAAWPWVARSSGSTDETQRRWLPVVGGAAIALAAGAVLLLANRLDGPTLWSEARQPNQVVIEIVGATAFGALIGFVSQTTARDSRTT